MDLEDPKKCLHRRVEISRLSDVELIQRIIETDDEKYLYELDAERGSRAFNRAMEALRDSPAQIKARALRILERAKSNAPMT